MISTGTVAPYQTIKTILLAEDDLDDQEFITEALLQIDPSLTIHTVCNGTEALKFLEQQSDGQLPQLLILDYNLPERDGAEVLHTLQQNRRCQGIVKIVWSTSNAPLYKARSIEMGATFYMVKPSTINGIEHMARQMLNLSHITS